MRRFIIALLATFFVATPATALAHNAWYYADLDREATYVAPTTIYGSNHVFGEDHGCPYDRAIGPYETWYLAKGYVDASKAPAWNGYRNYGFAVFQEYHWHPTNYHYDTGYATDQWGGNQIAGGTWSWAQMDTRRVYSDTHPFDNSSYGLWIKAVNTTSGWLDIKVC